MKNALIIIGAVLLGGVILNYTLNPRENRPEPTGTGIMGEVRLGPTCPGKRVPPGNDECADKLYQGDFELTDVTGTVVIREFSTDENGQFKVDAPDGEYVIRNKPNPNGAPYPACGKMGSIPVVLNEYTDVIVFCDTGIR